MATFLIGHKHSEPITMSQFRDLGPVKRRVKYISTNAYPHILPDNSSTSTSFSSKDKRLPLSRLKLKTLDVVAMKRVNIKYMSTKAYSHKLPDNSSTSTSFSSKNEGQPLTRLELKILDRVVINPLNINIFKDNNISLRSLVPIAKLPSSGNCSNQLDNPKMARQRRNISTFEGRLHHLSRIRSLENTFVPETFPFKYTNTILAAPINLKVIVPATFDIMNDLTTKNFGPSYDLKIGNRRSKYLHIRIYYRNLPNVSCKIVCTSVQDAHLLVNRLRLKSLVRVILDRLNINHFQDNRIRLRSAFPIAKRLRNYKSAIKLGNIESPSSTKKSSHHKERSNPYNRSRGSDKDVMADKYLRDYHSKDREYCTKLIVIVPKRFVRIKDLLTSNVSKLNSNCYLTDTEYCTKLIVRVPQRFVRIKDLLANNVSKMKSKWVTYPGSLERHPKPSQLLLMRAPLRFQPRPNIPENTKDAASTLNDFGHCSLKNFVNYMLWKENELCTTDMTTDLSL